MKIVKYIFLLLLLAAIAVTVFIATQDGKYNIRQEKVVNAPLDIVYNYVNDYKNWENLGLLTNADTTAQYTYSEITTGKGATMSWQKNDTKGKVQTLNATGNDSISQKLLINDLNSDVSWHFKDTIGGTKVAVELRGKLTFTEKAYSLLNGRSNTNYKASLKKGLDNLTTFLVSELKAYNTEVKGLVTKKQAFYLGQTATSPLADVHKNLSNTFSKLAAFAKENKITITGAPFILYKNINKELQTATYTYCIPIKDEIFTAAGSEYEGGNLPSFTALKTTLKGDYSHMPKAWRAANNYIAEKALQENTTAQYVEVYTKSSIQSRRPSQWITDVYIPIGAPQIVPTPEAVPNPPVQQGYSRPAPSALSTTRKPVTTPATTKPPVTATPTTVPSAKKPVVKKPATAPATEPAGQ